MVKVSVYIAAFYFVYKLILARDTSYARNRIFILVSLFSALVLPNFSVQIFQPSEIPLFGKVLSEVLVRGNSETAGFTLDSIKTVYLFHSVYIVGIILFLLKLAIDLMNLAILVFRQREAGTNIIRFHGFKTAGFSALGYIFINTNLSNDEAIEIEEHEQNHLRFHHFLDIIFIEIVKALQWFNPAVYLLDRDLRAIHEFQADQLCLNSGITIDKYQSLIFSHIFKSRVYNLSNSFSNPSLTRKRMIMMTRKRTPSIASLKLLMVIPVIIIVFSGISAFRQIPADQALSGAEMMEPPPPPPVPTPVEEETPFVAVDEMPQFPGGDAKLLEFIAVNTIYPDVARENNIQGRVIVRFCVGSKGNVSQASILKGVSEDLDNEALRVVEKLPLFKPGRQGGKDVPVWYMVPITFSLQ